jgi:hypothetical protein
MQICQHKDCLQQALLVVNRTVPATIVRDKFDYSLTGIKCARPSTSGKLCYWHYKQATCDLKPGRQS